MIFSPKIRKQLFIVFAVLAVIIAVYHVIGIFYTVDGSPAWRHGIFVCINLFCVYGILNRPKYFILIVFLLLVQQCYSHGQRMVKMWAAQQRIDWVSVFVLVLLLIALICLIEDQRQKSLRANRADTAGNK